MSVVGVLLFGRKTIELKEVNVLEPTETNFVATVVSPYPILSVGKFLLGIPKHNARD